MNIKELRVSQKMTQQKLAKKLNVSQQTIAKWEGEKSFPRSETLPKLAKVLKCKIEDLY